MIEERIAVLKEIANKMRSRKEDYVEGFAMDIGVAVKIGSVEVDLAVDYLLTMEEEIGYVSGKRPYGTVGGILPYDASTIMFARLAGSAFLAGNDVCVSFSSLTPSSRDITFDIVRETTDRIRINMEMDNREFGNYCTYDSKVRVFYISGGDEVGKLFESRKEFFDKIIFAGPSGMPICIVDKDVNIEEVSDFVAYRAFLNGGQYCTTIKRVLVNSKIYDGFMENLINRTSKIKVGDPLDPEVDYGPIKAERTIKLFLRLIESMKGRIILGGKVEEGGFIPPTLVELEYIPDLEAFGPFLGVIKFDDIRDAINYALSTRFRHIIYLFGHIPREELLKIREAYGMVYYNEYVRFLPVRMPYGGKMDAGWVIERTSNGFVKRDGPIIYSSEFCR
ncbi:MAG: aldehyde dehydrogenase family protein [Thermosulfidibacteraceae bacterium]